MGSLASTPCSSARASTWSSPDETTRKIDLVNYERHQLRLQSSAIVGKSIVLKRKLFGRIASGFMTEAEALDYIARYGSHKRLIEMERIKMKYGLDTGEG
jgi:hypothetical protein